MNLLFFNFGCKLGIIKPETKDFLKLFKDKVDFACSRIVKTENINNQEKYKQALFETHLFIYACTFIALKKNLKYLTDFLELNETNIFLKFYFDEIILNNPEFQNVYRVIGENNLKSHVKDRIYFHLQNIKESHQIYLSKNYKASPENYSNKLFAILFNSSLKKIQEISFTEPDFSKTPFQLLKIELRFENLIKFIVVPFEVSLSKIYKLYAETTK